MGGHAWLCAVRASGGIAGNLASDKPEVDASPKGTIPVVELADGTVLEESRDDVPGFVAE